MEAINIKTDYPRRPDAVGAAAEIRRDGRNEVNAVAECSSVETSKDGAALDFLGWLVNVQDTVRQSVPSRAIENGHPIGFGSVGAFANGMELYVEIIANHLAARFRTDLFAAARVQGLIEQLGVLVAQAVVDPGRDVAGDSLLTESARAIVPDSTAQLGFSERRPINERILAYAASAPGVTAVEQGGRSWRYCELSEASFAIASGLVAAALDASDRVAVTGPRRFGFVAAMLGGLRSDAVLVNIDPSLPEDRQEPMLTETKARFLVRVGPAASALTSRVEKLLSVSTQGHLEDGSPCTTAGTLQSLSPQRAAYVFFCGRQTRMDPPRRVA